MNYSLEQVENFVDLSRKILVTKCLYFNHDILVGSGHITLAIFSVYCLATTIVILSEQIGLEEELL